MDQKNEFINPCKVVLLGLPSSGKKTVAQILSRHHGYEKISTEVMEETLSLKELHKIIVNRYYENYKKKSVLVMQKCSAQLLHKLKKRNFTNIIYIDSPFKNRLQNFCKGIKNPTLENYHEFSNIDAEYQNQQFHKCLSYVRVRIHNNGTLENLTSTIQEEISEITRKFRPSWDQYFMKIADVARRRSNCMKSSVGAVLVNSDHRVVSTGYNGTPRGLKSCYHDGCDRCNKNQNTSLDECLCLHAQESAIMEAGINKAAHCTLYTTLYPCFSCAKVIKQAQIKKIYYLQPYDKEDNGEKFLSANYDKTDVIKLDMTNIYY